MFDDFTGIFFIFNKKNVGTAEETTTAGAG